MQVEYELTNIEGIGESAKVKLIEAGITSVAQLAALTPEELSQIKGFGLATSRRIIESAHELNKQKGGNISENRTEEDTYEPATISEIKSFEQVQDTGEDKKNHSIFEKIEPIEVPLEKEPGYNIDPLEEEFQEHQDSYEPAFFPFSAEIDKNHSSSSKIHNVSSLEEVGSIDDLEPLIQKPKVSAPFKTFIPYEEESAEPLVNEMVDKQELIAKKQAISRQFIRLGYATIDRQTNLLRTISKDVDLVAYKILEANSHVGLLVFFPIKLSQLKGVLLVSEGNILYQPTKESLPILQECVVSAQERIFRNLYKSGALFQLVRQKLGTKILSIHKTKDGTPLFIATPNKQYKPVIYPLVISNKEPAFLEKSCQFAYQRSNNVHVLDKSAIDDLVQFLEKKETLRESFIPHNAIERHRQSILTIKSNLQKFSIPVLLYGIFLAGMMWLQNPFVLAALTNMGIATLIIYVVLLWFVYRRYKVSQNALKTEFKTPRHQLPVDIDEIGILSLKDRLSSHELDQLLYEWFGKNCQFSCASDIEQAKLAEDQQAIKSYGIPLGSSANRSLEALQTTGISPIEGKSESQVKGKSAKEQLISKYSTFLED